MPSDEHLVSLCVEKGDRDAFSILVRRYAGMVLAVAAAILRDHHEAEDVAQEVLAKAYQRLGQLKERNRFSSWLTAIARNTASRHKATWHALPVEGERVHDDVEQTEHAILGSPPRTPAQQLARRELHERILSAIEELPEAYRSTVHLRCVKQHTCREIAGIEGVDIGVVTSRLSRAYAMLREKLGGDGKNEGGV